MPKIETFHQEKKKTRISKYGSLGFKYLPSKFLTRLTKLSRAVTGTVASDEQYGFKKRNIQPAFSRNSSRWHEQT